MLSGRRSPSTATRCQGSCRGVASRTQRILPDLFDRLRTALGLDRREMAMDVDLEKKSVLGMDRSGTRIWIAQHLRRERQWASVLRHLDGRDPTDLAAIVFDGVDKLQHLCWRFIDPACATADPTPWEARIVDLCLSYFHLVDNLIGELVHRWGPNARIFIASDHGFGPTTEVFYVKRLAPATRIPAMD